MNDKQTYLRVRGARTHNLRNVDVDIPHGKFVVVTGVSGSGKSSLVFDTILAESQRQFMESLSRSARSHFAQLDRPDVDSIEGIQPAIAVDQDMQGRSSRSTVATVTEIHDHLRLLFARFSETRCEQCDEVVRPQTPQQIVEQIEAQPNGTKVMLLAPMVRQHMGDCGEVVSRIRKAGLVRLRLDGAIYEVDAVPLQDPDRPHDIDAVVDRLVVRHGNESRLGESVRLALEIGEQTVIVLHQADGAWQDQRHTTLSVCPSCGRSFPKLEPRHFSFNSPYGACDKCDGLGVVTELETSSECAKGKRKHATPAEVQVKIPCDQCNGTRLRGDVQRCRWAGISISDFTSRTIDDAIELLRDVDAQHANDNPIVSRMRPRLEFLQQVGVGYLTLDRATPTLSGGEMQRVRLAMALGSGLSGVMYLVDEPSVGLHPHDAGRLIGVLRSLQQQGNSVIAVEHDESFMRRSDLVIDIGPGAGPHGGGVVALGTSAQIEAEPGSITGKYLADAANVAAGRRQRDVASHPKLVLRQASGHNLQDVTVAIPLEALVCVTGVSGSGKSSLVIDTLAAELVRRLYHATPKPLPLAALQNVEQVQRLAQVDQAPLGRSSRSTPATYTGVMDEIRKLYATTKLARQRGYKAARFSFNAAQGRCAACKGYGHRKVEMGPLPAVYATCHVCRGTRFNPQTLSVRFKSKTIADALQLDVDEAVEFFENLPNIQKLLSCLQQVGLGYLSLGQSATTLSGGEAQRVKLAAELGKGSAANTLYVLDEPTMGLHSDDVGRLLRTLQQLVDSGGTVLCIEHHVGVIRAADWVIDLGPGAGDAGGKIIATGPPDEIARCPDSITGQFL